MLRVMTPVLLGALLLIPRSASAQKESDVAAWIALITTPVGALAPHVESRPQAEGGLQVGGRFRYSHWQFAADDDNTSNYAGALTLRRGRVRAAFEVGVARKKDCTDCDQTMYGAELYVPLLTRETGGQGTFELALAPAVGIGRASRGEVDTKAIALEVPMRWAVPVGSSLRAVPFVAPGLGGGEVSVGSESSRGMRPMIAGGVAVQGTTVPFALTISVRKILADFGDDTKVPTIVGVGFSLSR